MKRVNDHIRDRLLSRVDNSTVGDKDELLVDLKESEWCQEFELLMRNRLLMGRFRYAKMNSKEKGAYDCVGSAIKRLNLYIMTGNLEHLVDVANLCLVEFVTSDHPDKHFNASDDGEHVERNA